MSQPTTEYYLEREHMEQAAAQAATCNQARRIHQRMANRYAELARAPLTAVPRVEDAGAGSALVFITRE